MADTTARPSSPNYRPPERFDEGRGFGWILFAAIIMIMSGALQATYGLIAVVNDEWVVWGNQNALYLDLTQWGWLHLVIGVIVAVAGAGLLSGNFLARIVGIAVACVSLFTNFLFLPAYPLWSLVVIAIDLMVIWSIGVHGGDLRTRTE